MNVIEEKELEESSYTFRPQLDKLSMNIEHTKEEIFGKVPRYTMLIQKGKEYKKKATEKKMEKEDTELEQCTFKPQINPDTSLQKRRTGVASLKDSQDSLALSKQKLQSSMRKGVKKNRTNQKNNPLKNHMLYDSNSGKNIDFQIKASPKPFDEMYRGQEDEENQQSSSSAIKDTSKSFSFV